MIFHKLLHHHSTVLLPEYNYCMGNNVYNRLNSHSNELGALNEWMTSYVNKMMHNNDNNNNKHNNDNNNISNDTNLKCISI